MAIPRGRISKIGRAFRTGSAYDLLIAVGAGVTAWLTSWNDLNSIDAATFHLGMYKASAGSFIMLVTLIKHGHGYFEKAKKESAHEIEGCLLVLYGAIRARSEGQGPDPMLRITVHVPISGDRIEQTCDYVGHPDRAAYGRGRRFSARCGIIGRVVSKKRGDTHYRYAVASCTSTDYSAYLDELMSGFNYREDEAKRLDHKAMAWMAVPLEGAGGQLEGIVYLDSVERGYFTEPRQELVLELCRLIASFVGKRYDS